MQRITKKQARTFLLTYQGLMGPYRFKKKQGVLDFIKQASCIQFDPIDVCGRNADLVLQSRVAHYQKEMLNELLYQDRRLIDYFDKNLAIYPVEDWPYFAPIRNRFLHDIRNKEWIDSLKDQVKAEIKAKKVVSTKDLSYTDHVDWYWRSSTASRVLLEGLFYQGEVGVHHKEGTIRYFSLIEDLIPLEIRTQPFPFKDPNDYLAFRLLRRIGAVGMLWNRPSDAFLGIHFLSKERNELFNRVIQTKQILPVEVEGVEVPLYILSRDHDLFETLLQEPKSTPKRVEFIAPLDNLLWDRKLIKQLFDFEYTWEIYKPQEQRQYGYYVLPLLYGDQFVARIEMIHHKKGKFVEVKKVFYEKNFQPNATFLKAFLKALDRFAQFHQCNKTVYQGRLVDESTMDSFHFLGEDSPC